MEFDLSLSIHYKSQVHIFKKAIYRLVYFILLAFPHLVFSQAKVFFETQVPSSVIVDQPFEIRFVLYNDQGTEFEPPSFEGIKILGNPGISQNSTNVNGVSKSAFAYVYNAIATKIGTYTIGTASIKSNENNKVYKTNPSVFKAQAMQSFSGGEISAKGDVAAKMRLEPSTELYVGQQATYFLELFFDTDVGLVNKPKITDLSNFEVYDLQYSAATIPSQKVKSRVFKGVNLDAFSLFPKSEGIFNLEPSEIYLSIDKGPFSEEKIIAKTNKLKLNVKPLPTPPQQFNKVVGDYKIETAIDKTSYVQNQSIALKVTVSGNGQSSKLTPPILLLSDSFEIFAPKLLHKSEDIVGNILTHTHEYEYVFSPKYMGKFKPSVEFTYFDPNKKDYIKILKQLPVLTISKGNASQKLNLYQGGDSAENHYHWYYICLGIGVVLLAGWWWYARSKFKHRSQSMPSVTEQPIMTDTKSVAIEKLKVARQCIDSNNYAQAYEEIGHAVQDYVATKFNIEKQLLSHDHVISTIDQKYYNLNLGATYQKIIQKSELSMYGNMTDHTSLNELYTLAIDFITSIEKG